MSESPQEPRPKSNRELAKPYWIHGIVVGPLFFVMKFIDFQAAFSEAILVASVVTSLLQPVPMFIVAFALSRGWRWGRLLAMSLPVVVIALCSLAYCFVVPVGGGPPDLSFILPRYFCNSQMFNFPGALILAILTARSPRNDPK